MTGALARQHKNMIVIHHSATDDSGTVSWDDIERYHVETQKWADIGYHYGVEQTATGGYQALVGRPEQDDAAAVKEGMANRHGIHICCVGDYDKKEPPKEMLEVLVKRLIIPIMKRWGIPGSAIRMHREFASYKSCPGKKFPIDLVKKMVQERFTR